MRVCGRDEESHVGSRSTESSHVGLVLGKVPVQFSRDKSHKYRGFGPTMYIRASNSFEIKVTIQSAAKSNIQG